jgi:hypothetical protein
MEKAKVYQGKLQNIKRDMYGLRDKTLKLQVRNIFSILFMKCISQYMDRNVLSAFSNKKRGKLSKRRRDAKEN